MAGHGGFALLKDGEPQRLGKIRECATPSHTAARIVGARSKNKRKMKATKDDASAPDTLSNKAYLLVPSL